MGLISPRTGSVVGVEPDRGVGVMGMPAACATDACSRSTPQRLHRIRLHGPMLVHGGYDQRGAVPTSTAPGAADAYTAYQGRLGCHSRASFWASAICAGVMRFAMSSLALAAVGRPARPTS